MKTLILVALSCIALNAFGQSPFLKEKLAIRIPKADCREATIPEVLDWLCLRAKSLDPKGEGLNAIYKLATLFETKRSTEAPGDAPSIPGLDGPGPNRRQAIAAAEAVQPAVRVTYLLHDATVADILKELEKQGHGRLRYDERAVVYIPAKDGVQAPAEPRPKPLIAPDAKELVHTLEGFVVPKVEFSSAKPSECMEFFNATAKGAIPGNAEKVVVEVKGKLNEGLRVDLKLSGASILDAMRYVAELGDMDLEIQKTGVVFSVKKK